MGTGAHGLAYSSLLLMKNKAALSGKRKEGRRRKKCFARISQWKIKQHKGNAANESIIRHQTIQKYTQIIIHYKNIQNETKRLLSIMVEEEWHQY